MKPSSVVKKPSQMQYIPPRTLKAEPDWATRLRMCSNVVVCLCCGSCAHLLACSSLEEARRKENMERKVVKHRLQDARFEWVACKRGIACAPGRRIPTERLNWIFLKAPAFSESQPLATQDEKCIL